MFFPDSDLTRATRSALNVLVEREQHRCGSRVVAYDHVAHLVGMSSSWLQKFLRNSGEVREPRITLFLLIRHHYENLCLRIEQENEADERRLRALKDQIDALAGRANAKAETEDQTHVRRVPK